MSQERKTSNAAIKALIVVALVVVVGAALYAKRAAKSDGQAKTKEATGQVSAVEKGKAASPESAKAVEPASAQPGGALPKLVDLGAGKCIPCKMMAPILEELRGEYKGRFDVVFVDVWENPKAGDPYGIKLIPTQIFFDAKGKELFRHEGFFSKEDILAKWKELGVTLGETSAQPKIERWEPAQADSRTRDQICYMCDGDIGPKTAVQVQTEKGTVRLCSPHCYFIMYSCLTEDRTGFEGKVLVADYPSGNTVPALNAVWLAGAEEKTSRPWIKAFESRSDAQAEMRQAGGNLVAWEALKTSELSHRCGFCDRAIYPQDAAAVLIEGVQSWGCCAHCAMGVAARTGKNIEVHQPDALTGEMAIVKTINGSIASIDPPTAVAWFGKKKNAEGKWGSAGCFHQGFFRTPENLRTWLEQHPYETGEMITIHQSLADKMKLSPQQIQNACKIGECAPR